MATTTVRKPTGRQQAVALELVAAWLGTKMGYPFGESAPTGVDAYMQGRGPLLNPEWQGWSTPAWPTILLEGGPEEWAVHAVNDPMLRAALRSHGLWAEPATHYALHIHKVLT